MTLFDEALQAGRDAMRELVAVTATYTPPGGVAVAGITAVMAEQLDDRQLQGHDRRRARTARITLHASDVTTPEREATWVVATGPYAGTWYVTDSRPLAGGDHDVGLTLRTTDHTLDESVEQPRGLGS